MVVPSFESRLDGAKDIPDIFELVKLAVRETTGKERSGLMLGLSNLGGGPDGFVGASYPVATNIIVMNTMPLDRIKQTDPALYKPYIFHILLHEYIHALGTIDEAATREKASEISARNSHPRAGCYPVSLLRILEGLYPLEIGIVIPDDRGYYTVVQLLDKYAAQSIPPFEAVKTEVESRYKSALTELALENYINDLYSLSEIEINK